MRTQFFVDAVCRCIDVRPLPVRSGLCRHPAVVTIWGLLIQRVAGHIKTKIDTHKKAKRKKKSLKHKSILAEPCKKRSSVGLVTFIHSSEHGDFCPCV